ncbi:AI-2E family transporter [Liquorilactobacillus ghanensis]|uniref:AI-2E family transporter n=1 Tax=Liquorilactobacillus ghanensis TaxID=399370 RepID=UPI0039EBE278
MLDKIQRSKLLWVTLELLLLATLIFVCSKISFIFRPLGTFASTLFAPVLIAGFLYYLVNPIVKLLMKIKLGKRKISRTLAVSIVFILLIGIIGLIAAIVVPLLINEISQLIKQMPQYIDGLQKLGNDYYHNLSQVEWMKKLKLTSYATKMQNNFLQIVENFASSLTNSLGVVIGTITTITITIVTIPFILFYMLKDGQQLIPNLQKMFPSRHEAQVEELMKKLNTTLSRYIAGQVIECLFIATFTSIGYWIIGMPYAFLLGVTAGMTNIIPYIGPYIGILPALVLGLTFSTQKALLVIVVCVIVQQVDGNLVYPNVIGKSLSIHPLTIIILLLVAGNLAGIVGMILAVPTYAVLKTVVKYLIDLYRLRKAE